MRLFLDFYRIFFLENKKYILSQSVLIPLNQFFISSKVLGY